MIPGDAIDIDRILDESIVVDVEQHELIDSTQARAHKLIEDDADTPLPLLVVSDEQTAGRGRGSNSWWTGPGSLAASLVFDPSMFGLDRRPLPHASLAAGVAVIDAVSRWIGEHGVGLHWPNDVFAGSRKLSGILIDVLPSGVHILGIGLNVNNNFEWAPPDVQSRAVSMVELVDRALSRTDVLLAFLAEFDTSMRWLADDPEEFGTRFNDLCSQIGHDLTVESSGRQISGRCAGIAPDGALLLDTLTGRQTIYSGTLR